VILAAFVAPRIPDGASRQKVPSVSTAKRVTAMSSCLLASPDCHGELKPLAVVSDEELAARFPFNDYTLDARERIEAIKSDPRRWVTTEVREVFDDGDGGPHDWREPTDDHEWEAVSADPESEGTLWRIATGIAHVCERHREAALQVEGDRLKLKKYRNGGGGWTSLWLSLSDDNQAFLAEFGADA
jgi:hypothetical protein